MIMKVPNTFYTSVDDRLPDPADQDRVIVSVLISNGSASWRSTDFAWYDGEAWESATNGHEIKSEPSDPITFRVTHWMPLPEEPAI